VKRITRNAVILLGLAVLTAALFYGWKDGFSVFVGGLFSVANFIWISKSSGRLLQPSATASGAAAAAGYLLRLVLIFGTLFAMIHFSFVSLWGVLLGLSVFVLSTILEAFILLYEHWIHSR